MSTSCGDITTVTRGILVHGCNARGVMGAGVALAIRHAFPAVYRDYCADHAAGRLRLGHIVWTRIRPDPPLAVASAVTQNDYGRDGRVRVDLDAVRAVFQRVGAVARRHGLRVHYPRIGAGLGGGDWSVIAPVIEEALAGVDHTLWTWDPRAPAQRLGTAFSQPTVSP